MEHITLIASDFDRLDIPCWDGTVGGIVGTGQYCSNTKCPIAKALKRTGLTKVWVYPDYVNTLENKYRIDGTLDAVERCRLELLAGAEEAYIKVLN